MADFPLPKTSDRGDQDAARRLSEPVHTERHIRIICAGAGASGLLMAYKLQKHFQNFHLTIYEKNPAVSGTWYENKYPGCACDVPSHNYTWSFEPKLDWSAVYPPAKEIFEYFDGFAEKYRLKQYVKLQHQVIGAAWDNHKCGYVVKIKNVAKGTVIEDFCDVFINAGGILNNWKWPAITGLDNYKGTLLHTANWDESVDLQGKHVGLIGNGSSGIQVLPAIREKCKKVTTFIREPTWISPADGLGGDLGQHKYSEEKKAEFRKPGVLLDYRKNIESTLNGQFGIFFQNSQVQQDLHAVFAQSMKDRLQNQFLESKLIPDWSVGCRRLTPGVNYLESLTKPNVEVVYGEINSVTQRGCLCDNGNEYPVDVLICATGFDTSFKPRFPIISHTGENLEDKWADDPQSYFGVAVAGFPNYLVFLGPNCPIGNGPVLSGIEGQADWMCKMIDRYQTTNIKMFMPKEEAVQDFIDFKDSFMTKTIWTEPCKSWYKRPSDGRITALWPGSTLHYLDAIRDLRMDDFDIIYSGNRFAWLGNGYSQTQLDATADWAYYIREKDDDPPLSTAGRRKLLSKSGTIQGREMASSSDKPDEKQITAKL